VRPSGEAQNKAMNIVLYSRGGLLSEAFWRSLKQSLKGLCTLFEGSRERSRASIKGRLFENSISLKRVIVYFVRGENC